VRSCVLALGLALIVASNPGYPAQAEASGLGKFDPTGNDYVSTCIDAETNAYDSGMCMAFTHGVLEGALVGAINNAPYQKNGSKYLAGLPCIPDGVTNSQMMKVVMRFADKNPEGLQYPAGALVMRALRAAWGEATPEHPCA
jgi:Rap1a immunity proteins